MIANCRFIPNFLVFQDDYMGFCCSNGLLGQSPSVALGASGDIKTLAEKYVEMRDLAVAEMCGERNAHLLNGCLPCPELQLGFETPSGQTRLVDYINLSFYPSVCQCKCIYCGYACNSRQNNYEKAKYSDHAAKAAGIIGWLSKKGYIDHKKCRVQISSGEITINPHRELILDSVKDFKCLFFTNGFVYDSKIAEILAKTTSYVQCSLDAGTPETYKRIKGFDNWGLVLDNLSRYLAHGNVVIKYLLLPGINDNDRDFEGIIGIMKRFGRNCLHISRDYKATAPAEIDGVCYYSPTTPFLPGSEPWGLFVFLT
jgi:pyruvate-formate lyase-activating enzyme